jgi:RNA recognition motif-containing protein
MFQVRLQSEAVQNLDTGALLFISSLDLKANKEVLYDTFIAFNSIVKTVVISQDPEKKRVEEEFGFITTSYICSYTRYLHSSNHLWPVK